MRNNPGLKTLRVSVIFAAIIGVASCSSSEQDPSGSVSQATESIPRTTLRVGQSGVSLFPTMFEQSGAFEDLDYDIELVEFDSSSQLVEGLLAGAVDVAHLIEAPTVILAQGNAKDAWTAESAPISIVASWSNPDHPGFSLVVSPEIDQVSDLEGKKVAYSKGSLGHFFFEAFVEQEGLQGVEGVQLPPTEGRAAFLSGAVDAVVTVHRSAIALVKEGGRRILDSSSRILGNYYQVTVVRSSLLQDPSLVASLSDFLSRSKVAAEWASDNLDVVKNYLVDQGLLDEQDAELAARYEIRRSAEIDERFTNWLRDMARVFLRTGVIALDIDTAAVVDTSLELLDIGNS